MDRQHQLVWSSQGEEDFNRWAEALITQKHVDEGGVKVFVLEGSGGDGGIDVGVERDGKIEHVYQLKWYREGFSGGFRDTRRRQIKKSFNRAVKSHNPILWTLVLPAKIRQGERDWLYKLPGEASRPKIDYLGSTELDLLLAKYPRIHDLATRDALVETLRIFDDEHKALIKPGDLPKRLVDLAALANSRSLFWALKVEVDGNGNATSTLVPKRPDAAEKEPIAWKIGAEFGPEHKKLQKRFEHALDYGPIKPVVLPAEVVRSLSITGPEWIAEERSHVYIELHPAKPRERFPLELKVLGAMGNVRATLRCQANTLGAGHKGGQIAINFNGCLAVVWEVDKAAPSGKIAFTPDLIGASAGDAVRVIRFLNALAETRIISLTALGKTNTATMRKRKQVPVFVPPEAMEHMEDLAILEREFETTFVVKQTVSGAERKRARFVRMLREGKCPIHPGIQSLFGTLSGEAVDQIRDTLAAPHAMQVTEPSFLLEVQDQKLLVGQVATVCPHAIAEDAEEHLRAIDAGEAEGRTIIFQPASGTAFISYMPEKVVDGHAPIVPDPWGLIGAEEHPNYERLRALAAGSPVNDAGVV